MAMEILRILALLVCGAFICVRAMDYGLGYDYGYGVGSDGYVSGYGYEPVQAKLPNYSGKTVYKIKQMSHHLLEEDSENGHNFTLSTQDLSNLCFQADAGSSDNAAHDPVANCMLTTSQGETLYMNLMKIKTWKKTFYVKDTTGKGNYVLYFEGGAAPEKKGSFSLFSFVRKSGKNSSKVQNG